MKAIGYVRVSTDEQAREGISLEAQEAKIKAWAELNDYELEDVYSDAGISGKAMNNRGGLQEALNAVGKGEALVVYSLSRMSRSTRDTLEIAEALKRKGADLVSLCEKVDTTNAAGKMVFRMLAVLNEFERDQVSERTKAALAHKKAQGKKTGGDVPFGFELTPEGLLVENKDEQGGIRLIRKLKSKGYSLRKIAGELEARDIRTKTGKAKWNPKTVSMILRRAA
jgi:DNA invertase Pin-like site-specific DNA recombinase